MKRFCSFAQMLILLLIMSTTVFASSGKTYQLNDLGMSINIPAEYVVFTRNIADNDPNLSTYGLNKDDFFNKMKSNNIYLNAWDADGNFEIIVTMIDSTISDFNLVSDTILATLASSFSDMYATSGITVEKYEIYQHDQAKFIKIYINQPNGEDTAYGLQYYTIYDNKAINVTMQSYSGKIDSDKESILRSIVTTVHFDKEPLPTENAPDTEAFLYRDKDTGSEFTVPANWTQEPLSQSREYLDVKFSSNKEPGLSILYGSNDLWAEMSSSEKENLSRSDIDSSVITSDKIAEAMGIAKNKLSTVSYGGKEYYRYVDTVSSSTYGINLEVRLTSLMRYENGYAYTFQFSGDSNSPYYKDFESLLESVNYPAVKSTSFSNIFSDLSAVNILFNLLVTIAVYSAPIIIYRYGIAKQPVGKTKAKKITIIYGIIAFIVMSILIVVTSGSGAVGGAILFWSWVNYKILTGGRNRRAGNLSAETSRTIPFTGEQQKLPIEAENVIIASDSPEITQEPQTDPSEKDVVFCHKCGTKLNRNHHFCHKCGAKIIK